MNEGCWISGLVGNSTFWRLAVPLKKKNTMTPPLKSRNPKDLTSTFQSEENSMSSQAWLSPVLWNDREEGNCFETCSIFFFGVSWGWQGVAMERRPGHSISRMFTRHEVFFKRRPSPTFTWATQTEILESEHAHTPPHPPPALQLPMHFFSTNSAPASMGCYLPFCNSIEVTSRNA